MTKYYPKKPVRSFQDLQVYQLTYNLMVKITKVQNLYGSELSDVLVPNLRKTISKIPKLIATAHSIRFGNPELAIETLEQAMLNCNLAIHYLSVVRDMVPKSSELKNREKFRTLTATEVEKYQKQYLQVRGKILRLQMSWKKFAKLC